MDFKELEGMSEKIASLIDSKFKTPKEKKMYMDAMNDPKIKERAEEAAKVLNDLFKR